MQNVYVSEYSDTGNVIAITYEGTRGSYTARREKCRTLLNGVYDHINVRSMRYTVTGGDASTYYVNDAQSSVTCLLYTSGDLRRGKHRSARTAQSHARHRGLDRNGIDLAEERPDERSKAKLFASCLQNAVGKAQLHQLCLLYTSRRSCADGRNGRRRNDGSAHRTRL